jgi:hypothetical protein
MELFVPAGNEWNTVLGDVTLFYSKPRKNQPDDEIGLAEIYHAMISYPASQCMVLVFFRSPMELLEFSAKYPVLFKKWTTPDLHIESGDRHVSPKDYPDPDSSSDPNEPPFECTADPTLRIPLSNRES